MVNFIKFSELEESTQRDIIISEIKQNYMYFIRRRVERVDVINIIKDLFDILPEDYKTFYLFENHRFCILANQATSHVKIDETIRDVDIKVLDSLLNIVKIRPINLQYYEKYFNGLYGVDGERIGYINWIPTQHL